MFGYNYTTEENSEGDSVQKIGLKHELKISTIQDAMDTKNNNITRAVKLN